MQYGIYLRNTPREFWRLSVLTVDIDAARREAAQLVAQGYRPGYFGCTEAAVCSVPPYRGGDAGGIFKPVRTLPVTPVCILKGEAHNAEAST